MADFRSLVLSDSVIRSGIVAAAFVAAAGLGAQIPPAGVTPTTAQRQAPTDTTPRFQRSVGVLRPGDELNVVVYRNEELSGKFLINSQGVVQIPGLGVIEVAGLTPEQMIERLKEQMIRRGFSNPEIAVTPLIRISALGEVRNPSLYSVEPGTNILQLVTLSGGPTERADIEDAVVVREGRQYPVNLKAALRGDASGRLVLYSNDVLYIPRRSSVFSRENVGLMLSVASLATAVLNVYLISKR